MSAAEQAVESSTDTSKVAVRDVLEPITATTNTSSTPASRPATSTPLLLPSQRLTTQHSSSSSRRQRSIKAAIGGGHSVRSSIGTKRPDSSAAGSARQRVTAAGSLLSTKAVLACCSAIVGLLLGAWAVLSVQHLHTQVSTSSAHAHAGDCTVQMHSSR